MAILAGSSQPHLSITIHQQQPTTQVPFSNPLLSQAYHQQVAEDKEEDAEIARMRDMLLSTQQEIDRIIDGT